MPTIRHNTTKAERRKKRTSLGIHGTAQKPRISVRRSNKYVFVQAVDDATRTTLASAHDKQVKAGTKSEKVVESAKSLAKQLKAKKIATAVFDRGQYRYHGRVKSVAETLREEGIKI